ncbi:MAG TPA: glutathione S-transferase family protein [Burkholderiales bacterium]|nr:glutathione S-transferase family protein [Burkholderiales bacterium]
MKLYGYRNGRTLRAAWALEEVRATYDYVEVDLFKGEARRPAFLKLNPSGKVPVLVDAGHVITESAAICLHIGEKYPEARLLPLAGTPDRTECYRWISFILTELDAALWTIAKHRFALPAKRRVTAVMDTAAWEFAEAARMLEARVAECDYLAGGSFGVADILAGHVLLWAKSATVELHSNALAAYLERLISRPAYALASARTSRLDASQ